MSLFKPKDNRQVHKLPGSAKLDTAPQLAEEQESSQMACNWVIHLS